MLQPFEQVAFGTFLSVRERFEDAVRFEQPAHLLEAILQLAFGTVDGHGSGSALGGTGRL